MKIKEEQCMEKANFQNIDRGLCVICGNSTIEGRTDLIVLIA